jgi:NAD(P)-dependent dehydrogenase (short-subunit alcohol dehydrogenase family)
MEFSLSRVLGNVASLGRPLVVLIVGAVLFAMLEPRGRAKWLLLAYAGFAALVGFLLTGGAGVDWNHLYDPVIALAIATGLAVHRLGQRLHGRLPARAISALVALAVALSLSAAVPGKLAEAAAASADLAAREERVSKVVAELAAQRGPVLCETMALCYWAGKPHQADILLLRRRLLSGEISESEFRRMIDAGHFSMMQFHSLGTTGRTKRLPEAANDYILQKYESRPNAMGGSLLTPRGGALR